MFQKPKILSRPQAQARTHILSLLDFETVVWILGFSKSKSRKMGFPQNNFISNDFVPNSCRPVFHTPGVQEEHEVLRCLFPGPVRCASQSSSERVPFVSGQVTKMWCLKCKCSETVSKFDLLWHQIPQLVRTANEFSRKLMKLVCRYKSRRIWIDGTNSTNLETSTSVVALKCQYIPSMP